MQDDLGNFGERQTARPEGFGYFAHLSIYEYARGHCGSGPFLDLGCGTGYGCDYVHRSGVDQVHGLERESHLVEIVKRDWPAVDFKTCDLNDGVLPFEPACIPFIFSSNVFEHVAYPDAALAACARTLHPEGQMVIAVPPISSVGEVRENAKNIFHITNLPHWCWLAKLSRFFEDVRVLRHWFVSEDRIPNNVRSIIGLPSSPGEIVTRLEDFVIASPPEAGLEPTMTAVFHCERPRSMPLAPCEKEMPPQEWRTLQVEAEGRQAHFIEQEQTLAAGRQVQRAELAELGRWIDGARRDGAGADFIVEAVRKHISNLT